MHDSIRYINFAEKLEAGVWPSGYVNWYIGYCFIIFLSKVLSTGYVSIVLFQVVVALIAMYCLFTTVSEVSDSCKKAFFIALLFATSFQVQVWNVYILTESIFVSGIVVIIYMLRRVKCSWQWLLPFTLVLLFTMLQRPNGFIIILSLVLYSVVANWQMRRSVSKYLLALLILAAVPGFSFLNANTAAFVTFFKNSYLGGEIISGYKGVLLPSSKSLTTNDSSYTFSIVFDLISSDVLYFIKLASSKLLFLFTDVRPYYTSAHNLYIIVFLGLVYTLVLKNILLFAKVRPALFMFIVSFVVLNAGLIMITYADWDGRFLAPLLAPLLIIAGGANKPCLTTKA